MNKDFLETISKTFQRRFPCVSRTDDVAVILVRNVAPRKFHVKSDHF